ncbi:MAG: DNA gyrase inhibitor YacG [Alphaproteobacteria bacterium]|nr:DNA gyrase inhibitor YacG [Alphaproteobacteria bacterium]MCL2505204.1 DNA gyrase inhibitor YacG [Alphaproteobacteria bacterium]
MEKSDKNSCPVCKKPVSEQFKPFCSIRCANVDLGKWFSEHYVIPTDVSEDEENKQNTRQSENH